MAGNDQPIIIIRRKKKGGGEGHHGGAWKVAYADFVTAMMAFFLLLWLLNVTTDEQRHGIADYFTPASIARSESGAGGMMGGQTISAPGAMISYSTPPPLENATIPSIGQGEEGSADTMGKSDHGSDGKKAQGGNADKVGKGDQSNVGKGKSAAEAKQEALENARFKEAETQLRKAIVDNGALREFAGQILIDQTPEGLRIQIIDKENSSMFPSGSSILYEKSRQLMGLIGRVVARLPNELSIAGHTDSAPFAAGSRRDNWTLSTERANVSRSMLVEAGVQAPRIARIIGMADREPLDQDMSAAKNRRISITLLRQKITPSPGVMPAAPYADPAPSPSPALPDKEVLPSVAP